MTEGYSGDTNHNTATSAIDNQAVNKLTLEEGGLANMTLTSSPNPPIYNQSVTFTATVPAGVTGTVTFTDGTTTLGTGTISGTTATFTTTTLVVGTHPVAAIYGGDTNYNTATSAIDSQVVNKLTLRQGGLAKITLSEPSSPTAPPTSRTPSGSRLESSSASRCTGRDSDNSSPPEMTQEYDSFLKMLAAWLSRAEPIVPDSGPLVWQVSHPRSRLCQSHRAPL